MLNGSPSESVDSAAQSQKKSEESAWNEVLRMTSSFDDSICVGWKEQIANILLFAGLLSASVTGFAIKTVDLFDDDSVAKVSALLLAQIAAQATGNANASDALVATLQQTSQGTAIRINSFVFASLVLSVGSALFGIVTLQWVNSYRTIPTDVFRSDRLALRQAQWEGLQKWKVGRFIDFILVVLLLSLTLFLIGLIDFLIFKSMTLAINLGIFTSIIFIFLLWTTFAPAVLTLRDHTSNEINQDDDPKPLTALQTPQAWLVLTLAMKLIPSRWIKRPFTVLPTTWTDFIAMPNSAVEDKGVYDHWLPKALAWCMRRFNDPDEFDNVYKCLTLSPPNIAAKALKQLLAEKGSIAISELCFIEPEKDDDDVVYGDFRSLVALAWCWKTNALSQDLVSKMVSVYDNCITNKGKLTASQRHFVEDWAKEENIDVLKLGVYAQPGLPKNDVDLSELDVAHAFKTVLDTIDKEDDIIIVVMGHYGTRINSFINSIARNHTSDDGQHLDTGKGNVVCVKVAIPNTQSHLVLVKTPPLDNPNKASFSIDIAQWLKASYKEGKTLNGIVYLHRITDTRFDPGIIQAFLPYRLLCGGDVFNKLCLTTTDWNDVAPDEIRTYEAREKDLWNIFNENGAKGFITGRFNPDSGDVASPTAKATVCSFVEMINRNRVANIQKEMLDRNKSLRKTRTGKYAFMFQQTRLNAQLSQLSTALTSGPASDADLS